MSKKIGQRFPYRT